MMRQLIALFLVCMMLLGCERKHIISVDRLEAMSKINVLYVAIAEPYRLATENEKTSLCRLVRGGAYYSIDMSQVKTNAREVEKGGSITVILPKPMIESFPDPTQSIEFKPKTRLLINDTGLNRIRARQQISSATGTVRSMLTSTFL